MAARTDLEQLVYQMSTDIRQLERQNKRALAVVDGTANKVEARYKKLGKADMGKFLDQTFDRSRLAAFEVGAARIPIFGQALQALGPAGLAAAAGIGAAALAVTGAIQAMQFADEIDDTATKLNIGTEALQEYRYAITEVGGEMKDADAAIEGFQKKLGEANAGGRAAKWFERLGFSAQDLKNFDSTEAALEAVLDRISALGREADRAAVAEKLGLAPMVALAREGSDRLDELRQRARELGVVMDADLVKRGAAANQEFETMAKVIDVQLKSAIVDLGPAIVEVMKFVAWLARGLSDVADAFQGIENRRRDTLTKEYEAHGRTIERLLSKPGVNSPDDLGIFSRRQFNQSNERRGEIATELQRRGPPVVPGDLPGEDLEDVSSSPRGPRGPSAEEIAKRRAELERTLAVEIARLSGNERLVQVLEREADIARRIEQYRAAGLSAVEAKTKAAADQAQIDEARRDGQLEETRQLQRQHDIEVERMVGNERFAQAQQDRANVEREIEALVRLGFDTVSATTIAEANLLDIQRARAEVMARIVADAALERQLTLARLAGDVARVQQLERSLEITRRARQVEGNGGLNFGEGVGQATSEVDEEIAAASRRGFREGVRGLLDDLQDGGLEGVLSTIFDRVSDRLKDNLADMLTDYLFQTMGNGSAGGPGGPGGWQDAIGAVLNSFGRRAGGGPVSAGRPYIVGEKRPEVFVPGVSGTILPSVSAAARMPAGGRGAVHQTFLLSAPGSVLAADLIAQMKSVGATQALVAAGEAYARAKSEIPSEMAYAKRYSR